jgi:hypothetical protein
MKISVVAADTSKHDYILEVKNLLANHDSSNHNKNQFDTYGDKAKQLLQGETDSERKTILMLSA